MESRTVNIGSSLTKYTFTDTDGEVVAYFRMNPCDVRIAERANETVQYFRKKQEEAKAAPDVNEMICHDKELTQKINFILGYDASATLFGFMSATSVLDDGRIFASLVLETIAENLESDIKKRFEKLKAVEKYTAKYQ